MIDIACSILKTERKSLHSRKEISCSILQNEGKNIELLTDITCSIWRVKRRSLRSWTTLFVLCLDLIWMTFVVPDLKLRESHCTLERHYLFQIWNQEKITDLLNNTNCSIFNGKRRSLHSLATLLVLDWVQRRSLRSWSTLLR